MSDELSFDDLEDVEIVGKMIVCDKCIKCAALGYTQANINEFKLSLSERRKQELAKKELI